MLLHHARDPPVGAAAGAPAQAVGEACPLAEGPAPGLHKISANIFARGWVAQKSICS